MTQIELARKGITTGLMKAAAKGEGVSAEFIRRGVALGTIAIPRNSSAAKPSGFRARGIGTGLLTKVNANIGSSPYKADIRYELEKLDMAVSSGADTVMDLSTGGDIDRIRAAVLARSPVPVGTVPVYQTICKAVSAGRKVSSITAEEFFEDIESQARSGVDFMTLHCGVTKASLRALRRQKRICGIVSRGGAFLAEWIISNGKENPLYEQYDRLLEILRAHDVTVSLGDGLRPGATADASDSGQLAELRLLGQLVKRARARGVQAIVEGPGHMKLDEIVSHVHLAKKICHNAPYYVLGPLVTDVAAGFDHISSAIGSAVAAGAGVDFICYVTPSEHLRLPDVQDVYAGVMASRIAAHSGDLVKDARRAGRWDREFSAARKKLDWKKQARLALDPEKFAGERGKINLRDRQVCAMCGNYCAMKEISRYGL